MAFDPTQVQPAVDNSGNLVASAAPDVQPTTAPDISAVTGGPASPPPPAGTADTGDYQGAVPVARPGATDFKAGFRSGVTSATPAQYTMDSDGNLVRSNAGAPPKGGMAKAGGILGGILQGALEGASRGVAAQQGESGAAAAQRIGAQQDQVARAQAQQNFENTRAKQKDLLEHNLLTLQMTNLVKKSQYEADEHAQNLKRWGFENDENALKQHANDSGERLALANFNAELNQHAVQPIHTITKKPGDVDVTPQGPVQAGQNPTTILGQAATHAPNLVNGKATMIQNGGVGDSNGVHIYSTDDLKQPITKRFYYQVPTGLTKDDGTADMDDRVIDPDGKTTYYDVLGQINNANQQLDLANKKIGQQMTAAKSKADVAKTGAEAKNQLSEAAKNQATAALTQKQIAQLGAFAPPANFQPNANALVMKPQELQQDLQTKGVQIPGNYQTLYAAGHYKTSAEDFPQRVSKGSNQMDRQSATNFIRAYINPNYDETTYPAVLKMRKEFASSEPNSPGGNLIAFNTATAHLGQLDAAAQALQNGNVQALNKIAQAYGVQTGKTPAVTFNTIRAAVSGEIGKTFKGGAADIPERADIQNSINAANSPAQAHAVAVANAHLMLSKANSLVSHYYSLTGELPDETVNPAAAQVYRNMGIDPGTILPSGAAVPQGRSGGSMSPQNAGQVGPRVGDTITQNGRQYTVTSVDANGRVTGAR